LITVPSNNASGRRTRSRAVPCDVDAAASNVVVSAKSRPLPLLADEHDPVRRAGHRAADVDQVAFGIDLLDAEMRLRVARGAVMPRHALALDDTRRIGA